MLRCSCTALVFGVGRVRVIVIAVVIGMVGSFNVKLSDLRVRVSGCMRDTW